MRTIKNQGAQGDVLFVRVDAIPEKATQVARKGAAVLAHSETGHNHECEDMDLSLFELDDLTAYLDVKGDHADVVHKRPHDTHETVRLGQGMWMVRRQREYTPEGWRRVED